jgi:hypothetical protein
MANIINQIKNEWQAASKTGAKYLPDDLMLTLGNYTNVHTLGPLALKAAMSLTALSGIPQVTQVGSSIVGTNILTGGALQDTIELNTYRTNPFINLNKLSYTQFQDFRSRNGFGSGADAFDRRLDGTSAITRGSNRSIAYLAASAVPGGAYVVFNLNGAGKTGYGWGDHGSPYALRNDFTAQSNIATEWIPGAGPGGIGKWNPKTNALNLATPFRGDRVNAVDFGKRTLASLYRWKPSFGETILGINKTQNDTQDFIKFYFTGPKIHNGADGVYDDVMVFRATITTLEESYQAGWQQVPMIGRADPNYHYSSYSRDLSLSFVVAATDRDEMKPIYRKLNALAGYTAPSYDSNTIGLKGPWMRMTIGDLFVQQPVIIESLSYTLHDTDTIWEINIEDDPEMMQTPHRVSISMNLKVITDYLPEKGGQFYTLAKENDKWGSKPGTDNWLSDTITVSTAEVIRREIADAKYAAAIAADKIKQAEAAKKAGVYVTPAVDAGLNPVNFQPAPLNIGFRTN